MNLFSRIIYLFVFILLLSALNMFAQTPIVWRPISQAELAMEKPQVEADADAEAIFWEVRLDDQRRTKLSFEHYVRVKIFTERGRERFAKIDIPFYKGKKVENVAARVIKPDGSIVELQPQDIFEREIVRQRKIKVKAKSFAVPNIEPGVIVEYQYSEIFNNGSANGERLYFQRDIPIQKASYYMRPYKGLNLKIKPRNMTLKSLDKTNDGFYVATKENIPAFKEEPRMPPDEEVRSWAYLYYGSYIIGLNVNSFALRLGKYFHKQIKPNKMIQQKAQQLTANASTDLEKLKILYEFSQKEIKNTGFNPSATLSNVKIKRASDVLKYGRGDSQDIDFLFASLAKSINVEPFLVFSGNRSINFFNPNRDPINYSFIRPACILVRLNGKTIYLNPGTPYLPFGKLNWYEESVYSLSLNKSHYVWNTTPLSNYDDSKAARKGKFKLLEDGTLEGEVTLKYTGNLAIDRRRAGINDTEEKRKQDFIEELKETISTGEYSDIKIDNFESPEMDLIYSYRLRIPNYSQQTGKRMFFQPAVFQFNSKPEFSSTSRIHPIYFRYPWSEEDEITIELPKDFSLDNAASPDLPADQSKVGSLAIDIRHDKTNNVLIYKRKFYFGGEGKILFPASYYLTLKELFDSFQKAETHTLSLKKLAAK